LVNQNFLKEILKDIGAEELVRSTGLFIKLQMKALLFLLAILTITTNKTFEKNTLH